MKVTREELHIRLGWPLEWKEKWAVNRIAEFVIEMEGNVYNSFSVGKDSRTVKHIIDSIWDGSFAKYLPSHTYKKLMKYPKPTDVFCNTGLEFTEIVDYVKSFDGVEILKPKMGFTRVIKEIGVAVGSKKIAMMVKRLRKYIANPNPNNEATKKLFLYGVKKDGTKSSQGSKLPKTWHKLLNAPFKVSDECCNIFKKEPFKRYQKNTGKKPIVGTTVGESAQRTISYYTTGCNSFEEGKERCRAISIFTEQDIWNYAFKYNLRHCEVYYDRTVLVEQLDGTMIKQHLVAEKSTGCLYCLFGLHLEDKTENNRIQRLALSHPKRYDIVINKCGLGAVMRFCGFKYEPLPEKPKQLNLFEDKTRP